MICTIIFNVSCYTKYVISDNILLLNLVGGIVKPSTINLTVFF